MRRPSHRFIANIFVQRIHLLLCSSIDKTLCNTATTHQPHHISLFPLTLTQNCVRTCTMYHTRYQRRIYEMVEWQNKHYTHPLNRYTPTCCCLCCYAIAYTVIILIGACSHMNRYICIYILGPRHPNIKFVGKMKAT